MSGARCTAPRRCEVLCSTAALGAGMLRRAPPRTAAAAHRSAPIPPPCPPPRFAPSPPAASSATAAWWSSAPTTLCARAPRPTPVFSAAPATVSGAAPQRRSAAWRGRVGLHGALCAARGLRGASALAGGLPALAPPSPNLIISPNPTPNNRLRGLLEGGGQRQGRGVRRRVLRSPQAPARPHPLPT